MSSPDFQGKATQTSSMSGACVSGTSITHPQARKKYFTVVGIVLPLSCLLTPRTYRAILTWLVKLRPKSILLRLLPG